MSSLANPLTNKVNDISLNVAIRNLPESANENLDEKVNSLFSNGLKINSVSVASTERKVSHNNGKSGVVIAKLKTAADKSKVMTSKSSLKNNRQYPDVFIHNDQTRDDRVMSNNFKTIIDAINRGDKLSLHGSRVVSRRTHQNGNSRDNGHHTQSDSTRSRSDNLPRTATRTNLNSSSGHNANQHGQNSNSYKHFI